MWFRIVTNRDGSIASCEQVDSSLSNGRQTFYIEADTRAAAIKVLLDRYERNNKLRRDAAAERVSKARRDGLCSHCCKRPRGAGLSYCSQCLEAKRARRAELKAGAPKLSLAASTQEQKLRAQAKRAQKDNAKASKKANGHFIMVRVAYARCLNALDTMTPSNYRAWLVEQLRAAQEKERQSAERRTLVALRKSA